MITTGKTITVNYTGSIVDGQVFDTTQGRDPFKFIYGVDPIIEGFQDALLGKEIGDKFTVNIPVEKAYGPKDPEKIVKISKEHMPGEVEVDQVLVAKAANEQEARVVVVEVNDDHVVIDGNHPLAGKDLIFEIEVIEIV